jgi:hypothetical protein
MGNTMNTHGNDAQNSLICLVTPILAPWNIEIPSTPKQKSFPNNYSLLNPPLTNNAFIMTLVKLFNLNPSTTLGICKLEWITFCVTSPFFGAPLWIKICPKSNFY